MPLAYAFKHVYRSWKLFLALLIGITLACAFFAGIDIKANTTAKQALDQQLSTIAIDMKANIDTLNTTKMQQARNKILNIEGVKDAEIISSAWTQIEVPNQHWPHPVRIVGITDNSHVYDGWFNRPDEIGENETYLVEGSLLADKFSEGDTIQVDSSEYIYDESPISLNLTVKGLAQLNDKAYSIASGSTWMRTMIGSVESSRLGEDLLIVSWEKTTQKILDGG